MFVLSIQAYYKVNSRCFLNIIIILDRFQPESISCTSVHDQEGKSYNIKTVYRFVLSMQAYYIVNTRCFLKNIIIYDRFQPESISCTSVHDQ